MIALLFVYGTLKQGGERHHELISQQAHLLGRGKIQAQLFHINGESYPGAFRCESQDFIEGEIYKLPRPVTALRRLDEVEGCKEGLFIRELADVWMGNRKMKAWVYFYGRPQSRGTRIASGRFLIAQTADINK